MAKLALNKLVDGPWERVKGTLRSDLEKIESAINRFTASTSTTDGSDTNLLTDVIGILRAALGGTGRSSLTDHGVLVGQDLDPVVSVVGTTHTVLRGRTGNDPAFGKVQYGDLASGLRSTIQSKMHPYAYRDEDDPLVLLGLVN